MRAFEQGIRRSAAGTAILTPMKCLHAQTACPFNRSLATGIARGVGSNFRGARAASAGPRVGATAVLLLTCLAALLAPARVSAMETVAQRIADAGPAMAALWPGFWEPEQPFLLYEGSGACVLVSRQPPQSGFQAHPWDSRLWRGRCEGQRFRLDFLLLQKFGGIDAPAVRVSRIWAPAVAEPLLHEAFHVFQSAHFSNLGQQALRFDIEAGRDLVELKLHEAALLVGALSEDDPQTRTYRVRLALALRAQRLAKMGDAVAAVEDHFMRIEGSAEWVGIRARQALEPEIREASELRSRWRMIDRSAGATWERLLRWQSYHSGAAALTLLEMHGADWRQPLAAGVAPWILLQTHFGSGAVSPDDALDQAERLNRWADISRSATELGRLDRRTERAMRRFEGHRGERLELLGPARGFDIAFTARDIHSIDGGVLIVDSDPLVIESDWLHLEAQRRPLHVTDNGARLILLLSGRPAIEGCDMDDAGPCPADTVVRGRGLELKLRRPAHLFMEGRTLRLRAAGPAVRSMERPGGSPATQR